MKERLLVIDCEGDRLIGVLHDAAPGADTCIVIVVGGPQYRVGSHRQFVLMARRIAAEGIPVLRFDVRGMGDSEGLARSFDSLDTDIKAALDVLASELPGLKRIVLLGLCDAASASLIYGHTDSRVQGLVLLNPWVRTVQGEAKAYLRHYYLKRMLQVSFWRKFLSGGYSARRSVSDFIRVLNDYRRQSDADGPADHSPASFLERMRHGWQQFQHPVLVVISGRDLTAKEFMDRCQHDQHWRNLSERTNCSILQFAETDHTMSDRTSLEAVAASCVDWIKVNI